MKLKLLTLTSLCALAFAACGASATQVPHSVAAATQAPPAEGFAASGENPAAETERLIIKNADLTLIVNDPLKTVNAVTQLAENAKGFVVSTNTYQTTYSSQAAQQARMVIRVPGDQLTPVLEQIKGMAVEIRSENVSGQDVTADYIDLQSRLTNLEAKEKQLQAIMEQTTKTDEVLQVYDSLAETREQIEVIKGQMKYYQESAAFSMITLDLIPNVVAQPIEIGGWHPEGTAKKSIEFLAHLLQGLTDFLIAFTIVCAPFLLILGVPALLLIRWVRWNRLKTQASKSAED